MLQKSFCLFFFLFMICLVTGEDTLHNKYDKNAIQNEYYREWVAKVKDPLEADLIALETGFVNQGPVS